MFCVCVFDERMITMITMHVHREMLITVKKTKCGGFCPTIIC